MFDVGRNTVKRVFMAATAVAAWFALLLQFPLTIATSGANGITVIGAVITYFSFFTILTNLTVAVGLTYPLAAPDSRCGRFFSSAVAASGTAMYIAMVGAVYLLMLRHLWDPEGFQKIADVILHGVVPVMYVAYWILFVPKSGLRWKDTLWWSIYPLAYLAWILIRGAISGRYPYPFVDVAQLGYARVLFNAAMLLASFLVTGLAVVSVARWKRPKARQIEINS